MRVLPSLLVIWGDQTKTMAKMPHWSYKIFIVLSPNSSFIYLFLMTTLGQVQSLFHSSVQFFGHQVADRRQCLGDAFPELVPNFANLMKIQRFEHGLYLVLLTPSWWYKQSQNGCNVILVKIWVSLQWISVTDHWEVLPGCMLFRLNFLTGNTGTGCKIEFITMN